ncbi:MAG: phosphate acyltransferase, partial [Chitinivibrionales bacterium]|nr:phosphate acyltransferase [Chitinivibrionales bacterium]
MAVWKSSSPRNSSRARRMAMDPIRIAVDVAGGDFGVPVVLEGVLRARERWRGQFTCVLCGERQEVFDGLAAHGVRLPADDLLIEHCPDRIESSDVPSVAWRKRARASIVRCIALQSEGRVDASFGAGDTGILMAAAHFILGCSKGVTRPALAATIPTMSGSRALLLDVGANTNCRPEHLLSFGKLGREYMRRFYGTKQPRVALLNIGEEPTKGSRVVSAAAGMLASSCPGYAGFVEGNRV